MKDGGGVCSSADWEPSDTGPDALQSLRSMWLQRVHHWGIVPRLLAHVQQVSSVPLFSDAEVGFCKASCKIFKVASGCYGFSRAATRFAEDPEQDLCALLRRCSHWHSLVYSTIVEVSEPPPLELLTWDKPWVRGEGTCQLNEACARRCGPWLCHLVARRVGRRPGKVRRAPRRGQ